MTRAARATGARDPFGALGEAAEAWLSLAEGRPETPDEAPDDALAALVAAATTLAERVPTARRADWQKLVDGFGRAEPAARRRARIAGLVRACGLFALAPKGRGAGARGTRVKGAAPALAWADPVDRLPGLGPTARRALASRGVRTVLDLVWTLPLRFDDLREPPGLAEALRLRPAGRTAFAAVVKSATLVPLRGRRGLRVVLADPAGEKATAVASWFYVPFGTYAFTKPGARVLVVGELRFEPGRPVGLVHPDVFLDVPERRVVRPRYPRLGAPDATVGKAVRAAVTALETLPDPMPPAFAERAGLASDVGARLRRMHDPDAPLDTAVVATLVERLAFAEAFTRVLERTHAEARLAKSRAPALPRAPGAVEKLVAALGFSLTAAQRTAIDVIGDDLARELPMRRLLLGDVGTGKTAVALAAAAQALAAGKQVAILAPTSVLAEQYQAAVAPLARATGCRVVALGAGRPAAERRAVLAALASGDADLAVGTHALLSDAVRFHDLGLVVVDEQHRLGVAQRLALVQKAGAGAAAKRKKTLRPHLLALSATPIPRTLALALRGQLATVELGERPSGRPAPEASLHPASSFLEVVDAVRAACARGERAFWVVPRIDPDDEAAPGEGLASARSRLAELEVLLAPAKVGLVHGALPPAALREAMRAFRAGETQVLVGTTVVEVGVDVPEATRIVVEGAETFGLAQLHQLRGRVGRGDRPGRCLLVHADEPGELARARLAALVAITDGVALAKKDLELRGAGDLWGTRQHGAEDELVYLDPAAPPPWLDQVEPFAKEVEADDPGLARPEHAALGAFVRRFRHVMAVREEAG